jgi:peptidyl-prolyl cis-trans isomerase C
MRPSHSSGAASPGARRLLAAWAALIGLAGCAAESGVLARVGSRTITAADFQAAAQALAGRYPGPPDSAKAALLRDLVDREILILGALQEGLQRDTAFLDLHRRIEEQLLRQRLFEDLGVGGAPVSEAEIAALHRWRGQESRARVIVALDRSAIAAAHAEIGRGADFAAVARRYNLAGMAPPGGDLGWVLPGTVQGPLDDAIREAPLGAPVGPVEVPGQYWFLARVEERRPRARPPLAEERELLSSILRQRKQREIMLRAFGRLSAAYDVRLEEGGGQELVARTQPYAIQGLAPPEPTTAERSRALVRYRGGLYTLGDAFDDLVAGDAPRPNLNVLPTVERWLELRALERAALAEARRRLYQDEPALRRAVRERAHDYLLEGYVGREVLAKVAVGEDDLRALLAGVAAEPRLESARFLAVVLRDSAAARELAATAPQAEGLREAVATAGLGLPVRSESIRFPTDHPLWQPLEARLLATAPGGYIGPLPAPGGWMVIQLLSRTEAPRSVPPELRVHLEQQALERARAARLAALTDSLRRTVPVAVYPERLRRLPWPTAALPRG